MKIKVGKYYLDKEQTKIAIDESEHLLVVAGAGSGKTLTILGKIKYLIEERNISPKDILCISFTAKASSDLKRKIKEDLNLNIDVYTFHKLGLEILKGYRSFEISDDSLLSDIIRKYFHEDIFRNKDSLKIVLQYFHLKNKKSYEKFLEENSLEIVSLENLLSTFIHLFKSSNHKLEDFLIFLDHAKMTLNFKKYKREKLLLKMAINIYTSYQEYLKINNEIDFDDMLIEAKKIVDKHGIIHNWKYIIIDEFQDTSKVRFELIRSILKKTQAKLVAVGDDFQSIYRFTGCDLALFLDFKKIFSDAKILKIEKTYRNSQELINVAGKFVMQNKAQIKKKLHSDKNVKKPIIIENYTDGKRKLYETICNLCDAGKTDIMILGRNNKDILYFIDEKNFKIKEDKIFSYDYPNANINYLTVHKSKGLECDNVIIINLKDSILGFPNQMKDDSLLRFVSAPSSRYPFDEERRLFYVALTRTKNKVYLLTPKNNRSLFIDELLKNHKEFIEYKKKY